MSDAVAVPVSTSRSSGSRLSRLSVVRIALAADFLLIVACLAFYLVRRSADPASFQTVAWLLDSVWAAVATAILPLALALSALARRLPLRTGSLPLAVALAAVFVLSIDFLAIRLMEYVQFEAALVRATNALPLADSAAIPGTPGPGPEAAASAAPLKPGDATAGRKLYRGTCASCHGLNAKGIAGQGKDMTTSDFIRKLDDAGLVAFIKQGRPPSDPLNTTGKLMPPKGGNNALGDNELADIVAFVREFQSGAPAAAVAVAQGSEKPAGDAAPTSSTFLTADDILIARSVQQPAAVGPAGRSDGRDGAKALVHGPVGPRLDEAKQAGVGAAFNAQLFLGGLQMAHVAACAVVAAMLLLRLVRGRIPCARALRNAEFLWGLSALLWVLVLSLSYGALVL